MKKIILFILFCFISINIQQSNKLYSYCESTIEEYDDSFLRGELNDSTLYLALLHYEVKHPKAVLAQAKLESGNFTSRHCRINNNFLGLYNSRKGKYFTFDHWTDCIIGYKDMVECKLREGEDYYDFLLRIGYAEDPSYIYKVKQIEQSL